MGVLRYCAGYACRCIRRDKCGAYIRYRQAENRAHIPVIESGKECVLFDHKRFEPLTK